MYLQIISKVSVCAKAAKASGIPEGEPPLIAAASASRSSTTSQSGSRFSYSAGLVLFLGHCFPVYLGFKGGKGVATALGVFLTLAAPAAGAGQLAVGNWLAPPGWPMFRVAAELMGRILGRGRALDEVDLPAIRTELVARARRDPDVDVRVAATRALDPVDDPTIDRILAEIAEADPDQDVRYAAERLLYERRLRPGDGPSD